MWFDKLEDHADEKHKPLLRIDLLEVACILPLLFDELLFMNLKLEDLAPVLRLSSHFLSDSEQMIHSDRNACLLALAECFLEGIDPRKHPFDDLGRGSGREIVDPIVEVSYDERHVRTQRVEKTIVDCTLVVPDESHGEIFRPSSMNEAGVVRSSRCLTAMIRGCASMSTSRFSA